MFKRELKTNFKSFIVWLSILVLTFLVVFLIYPFVIKGENMKDINELMKIFPPEVLKAFNMDLATIDTAYGWLKTEGYVFILLVAGCYSSLLGSSIVLKEENDKTIEYLNSLPVSRSNIFIKKSLCGLLYIFLMIGLISAVNYMGLTINDTIDLKSYILLCITPLFSSLVLYFLSLMISTFFHKTKRMLGISLGVVFISYVLQLLSTLSDSVKFLEYFSVYTLADVRNVLSTVSINPIMITITLGLSTIFFCIALITYNKKELV